MPWFKVDDDLAFHRKIVAAGNAATGLWVRSGSWSAQQLTDGFIPGHMVPLLGTAAQAARLVKVGLWLEVDGGFQFHQWNENGRQPTSASVRESRERAAERQAKWRAAKSANAQVSEVRNGVTPPFVTPSVTPSVTGAPTRPVPYKEEPSLAPLAEDQFEAFWKAYPRRVERRAAEKAWRAALKRKTTPEQIITAARAYADRTRDTEPRFVKHPASWLNAGAYDDERPTASVQAPLSFEQIREQAAATEAARLLRIPYIPAPQPPSDRTPPQQWLHDRAVEFIAAHEHELRAALTERKTG
jgi:hypothetical protein